MVLWIKDSVYTCTTLLAYIGTTSASGDFCKATAVQLGKQYVYTSKPEGERHQPQTRGSSLSPNDHGQWESLGWAPSEEWGWQSPHHAPWGKTLCNWKRYHLSLYTELNMAHLFFNWQLKWTPNLAAIGWNTCNSAEQYILNVKCLVSWQAKPHSSSLMVHGAPTATPSLLAKRGGPEDIHEGMVFAKKRVRTHILQRMVCVRLRSSTQTHNTSLLVLHYTLHAFTLRVKSMGGAMSALVPPLRTTVDGREAKRRQGSAAWRRRHTLLQELDTFLVPFPSQHVDVTILGCTLQFGCQRWSSPLLLAGGERSLLTTRGGPLPACPHRGLTTAVCRWGVVGGVLVCHGRLWFVWCVWAAEVNSWAP